MLFLSSQERVQWMDWAREIQTGQVGPEQFAGAVRSNLAGAFHFFAGTLLAAKGLEEAGARWIAEGVMAEEGGFFTNAFLNSFLGRHDGHLIMPDVAFADPRPYVHFTTVPTMAKAREQFLQCCAASLPPLTHPFRFMDIGCGDGSLTVALLRRLQEAGKITDIGEILLIDASPAMIALAKETVGAVFPPTLIKTMNARIEAVSESLTGRYDLALASLAYHHMPWEKKIVHLRQLRDHIDHFIVFEVDANNDTPELFSPELALAVYQSYGAIIDFVFSHDAPVEVALACVDRFLMTEAVSLMTQPRGIRTEYHMLNGQWHDLAKQALGPEFLCLGDTYCYADRNTGLFTLHYGR